MPHIARRGLLGLGVATLALSGCSSDAARTNRNFVLVHGSLHGGWCWRRVAKLLRAAGGEVFTPTLTGLGERSHLNSPRIGLTTHIKDVANCIVSEELERVILVGHSYAGIVITGVVQSLSDRISDLVYLDALV